MQTAIKPHFLEKFQCSGPECPDTCCKQFTVLVDPKTLDKYEKEAPELLDFITEKEGIGKVLQFDQETGHCPKMTQGSCSIHANYGTDFLTDVCHLYPRITRTLGDTVVMSATVSCPEVARLALFADDAFEEGIGTTDRIPFNVKDYLPEGMPADDCIALNKKIISLVEQSDYAEIALKKLAFFSMRFGEKPFAEWKGTLDAGWNVMQAMLPAPAKDPRDPFFLLIALTTLLAAAQIKPSPRLAEVLKMIETALDCKIDSAQASVDMGSDSIKRCAELNEQWDQHYAASMQPILKRLVMAKMHSCLYPFGGLGINQQQRMSWLTVHYATIRLGLMALCSVTGQAPEQDGIIHVVQTITRVLDHLNNLDFALPMYDEAGWLKTERIIGLLD